MCSSAQLTARALPFSSTRTTGVPVAATALSRASCSPGRSRSNPVAVAQDALGVALGLALFAFNLLGESQHHHGNSRAWRRLRRLAGNDPALAAMISQPRAVCTSVAAVTIPRMPSSTVDGCGRRAVIVAQQHQSVIRVGADHGDRPDILAQRQKATLILKQHQGLPGDLQGQGLVGHAVNRFGGDVGKRHPLGGSNIPKRKRMVNKYASALSISRSGSQPWPTASSRCSKVQPQFRLQPAWTANPAASSGVAATPWCW
jgi:hypothetical protein